MNNYDFAVHHSVCILLLFNTFLLLFSPYSFITLCTENVSDPETMSYTAKDFAKGFTKGTFKFTVKAYTAAGENTGTTATVTIEPYST